MNAVGIDVSKGKSTVAVLRPFGEIVIPPFDVIHSHPELSNLVALIKGLKGEVRIVMEYTSKYYLPIANFLINAGLFVSVVNPLLVKEYGNNSIRKVKTDKKDSLKLAAYALDRWNSLQCTFAFQSERELLKSYTRQFEKYSKLRTLLKNNLISLLDQTFPGINNLFSSYKNLNTGHEKWIDFVAKFPHCECISGKPFASFCKTYLIWCRKLRYRYSEEKAKEIHSYAKSCIATLPNNSDTAGLLQQAVSQINLVLETSQKLCTQMVSVARKLPEYETVSSMFCVSDATACYLMAEIGDIRRFKDKHSLVAFAGIDSPPFQSGSFENKSRAISKRGSASLRRTLFLIMAMTVANAPQSNVIYDYICKKREQGKHYYVALIAGANKFLRIYYAKVKALFA